MGDFTTTKLKGLAVAFVVFYALMLYLNPAHAGGCASLGVVGGHAYHAPVVDHHVAVAKVVDHYQAPIVNYFVGAPVREEAIIAKALEHAFERIEAKQTKTTTTTKTTVQSQPQAYAAPQQGHYAAPQQACPTCQDPAYGPAPNLPPAEPAAPPRFNQTAPGGYGPAPRATLNAHCAQCHTGEAARGGFDLDTADADQWRRAAIRVTEGTMPEEGPLVGADLDRAQFELWRQEVQAAAGE